MTLTQFIPAQLVFLAVAVAATLAGSTEPRITVEVKRYWGDPVSAFARDNSKTRPDYFEFANIIPFPFTSFYADRLKQVVFVWDPTDTGAPRFDLERPLGQRDLVAQLANAKSSALLKIHPEQQRFLARSYVQTMFALGALLQHGTLATGIYTPQNVSSAALREQMRQSDGTLLPVADLNLNEQGGFIFTERHRALLKHMVFDWPNKDDADELLAIGRFPGPRIDPKRPYGNQSLYQVDMATLLKAHSVLQQKDGQWFMPEAARQEYTNLHRQMLYALQVFVENAELKPGSYTWVKP